MTYKIILGSLHQHIFLENYSYQKEYMKEETQLLNSSEESDEQSWQNLKFVLRVVRHGLSVKDEDVRYIMSRLFSRLVDVNYNWQKEYKLARAKGGAFLFYVVFQNA